VSKAKKVDLQQKTIETADVLLSEVLVLQKKRRVIPNMYGIMANKLALIDAYIYSYESFRKNVSPTTSRTRNRIFVDEL